MTRFSPISIRRLVAVLLTIAICLLGALLSGCRTAGPQVTLTNCPAAVVNIPGATDAAQGKAVPIKALADNATSLSESGDATTDLDDTSRQTPAPAPSVSARHAEASPEASPTPESPPAGGVTGDSE